MNICNVMLYLIVKKDVPYGYVWRQALSSGVAVGVFCLRPILNFAPRGKLSPQRRSCPPGMKFCPLGVKLSHRGEIFCLPLHSYKQYEGGERRGEHSPRGQISPLGARVEVKNDPLVLFTAYLGMKFCTRLWNCLCNILLNFFFFNLGVKC
jgi:hypothetical protein